MDVETLIQFGEEALDEEPTSALKFHWEKSLNRLKSGTYSLDDTHKIMYLLERSKNSIHKAFLEEENQELTV